MRWGVAVLFMMGYAQGVGHGASIRMPTQSIDLKPINMSTEELRVEGSDRNLAKGQELAMAGEYEKALSFLERSRQSNPNNAVVWYWIAYCQEKTGKLDAAIQSYETALQKNPKLSIAWWGKGNALLTQKSYAAASHAFQRYIALNPKEASGYYYAGAAEWMKGAIDSAIAFWERAIQLGFADSARLWAWIGEAYMAKLEYDSAEKAYQRAAQAPTPPPEAWYGLGKLHLAKGNLEQALTHLTRAESLLPEDPGPPYYRGMTHLAQKDTAAARAAFQEALRRSPDHARSLYEMGRLALATEGIDEAQKYYEKLKTVNTRLAQQLLREIIDKK